MQCLVKGWAQRAGSHLFCELTELAVTEPLKAPSSSSVQRGQELLLYGLWGSTRQHKCLARSKCLVNWRKVITLGASQQLQPEQWCSGPAPRHWSWQIPVPGPWEHHGEQNQVHSDTLSSQYPPCKADLSAGEGGKHFLTTSGCFYTSVLWIVAVRILFVFIFSSQASSAQPQQKTFKNRERDANIYRFHSILDSCCANRKIR